MKIAKVKFFQAIEIPTNKESNHDTGTYLDNRAHDLDLVGVLVKIVHRESGNTVYATLSNISYIRELHEIKVESEPAPSPPRAGKKKQEQN